jgi:pyruvate kinase
MSAACLLHYLALRRHDLRGLQIRLAALGLLFPRSGGVTRPGYARRRSGGPAQTCRSLLATLLTGGCCLPQSVLRLSAMTAKNLADLTFVAQQADIVELSFVNTPRDVELLQQQLALLRARQPAVVVLKIETRRGFENLADLLLTAMRGTCCGVMIARGDLAVECGFERLAEVQEEILWICEAAHIPVIWATQVLETLAKEGFPSRAEITDAAMGERAECVMLNKGPHILEALRTFDDILQREQSHHSKKRSMLRHLTLADHFPGKI